MASLAHETMHAGSAQAASVPPSRFRRSQEGPPGAAERARLAVQAVGLATWIFDEASGIVLGDEALRRMLGVAPQEEPLGAATCLAAIMPADRASLRAAVVSALRTGEVFTCEVRIASDDGPQRWLEVAGRRLADSGGRKLAGTCADITERRRDHEAIDLTLRELDHRVKNNFAIALGMIAMTARGARTAGEMAERLAGRLSALARAHELLRPPVGSGAATAARATLAQMVETIVGPYLPADLRGAPADGPHVLLATKAIAPLAMLLQELATNAVKHGCLAHDGGYLTIRWRIEREALHLVWAEQGSVAAPAEPARIGFGSKLIESVVVGQLRGAFTRSYADGGLTFTATMPLEALGAA